ncbi:DUF1453 domain-containing protein [Streptomyces sp. VNUA116]|uniref:DUF1453 domain-containing protein n=1 Tax=Streptomyces sp. VNUA116 TaxID=3062449 RepID=UPI002676387E|nr:DUF1453 domain-containing protein [Streptomyces sp. VNUA116]WKU47420.1 DUF1453 domain-containing protein [Streptomyces sp. VNUA116]
MPGMANGLVIVAVVVLTQVRQVRPQRVSTDARSWWVLPAVLVFLAVREPGLIDPAHRAVSAGLLAGGVLAGLATGAAWAWSSRVWADASGETWAQGSRATAAIWLGGAALRLGLHGLGALAGVHQGSSATMVTVAAVLLARSAVVLHRVHGIRPAYRVTAGG